MIKVNYSTKKRRLTVKGHAGSGMTGKDIVCAAASMLSYTLGQTFIEMQDEMRKEIKADITSGDAYIQCFPKPEIEDKVDFAAWTVMNGFRLLETQYPNYISVKIS